MNEIPLDESFQNANSDEQRAELLTKKIAEQERTVFGLRYELAAQEGILEGFLRLREQLGAPTLSHKHTLRGRIIKYLTLHPEMTCTDLANALGTPVTTVNMCLHRNKELFEKNVNGSWVRKCIQSAKT